MLYRQFLVMLMCAGCLAWGPGRSGAALMAAPEQVPADSLVVLSVPDAPGLWRAVKESSLHDSIKNLLNLPAVQSDPEFKSFQETLKTAEGQLGMALDPDSLFTKTLLGVDIALGFRQESEEPDVLVVFKFKEPKIAETFLKQIEADANKGAGGSEGEQKSESSAPKLESTGLPKATYQTLAGQKVLVVPSQGLWAAQKGELLAVASSAEMMNKSLTTTAATTLDKAPFIRQGLEALGNPKAPHIFFYIDYVGVVKAAAGSDAEVQAVLKSVTGLASLRFLGVAEASPEAIQVRVFTPNPGDDPFVKEMAAKYPPTDMEVARLIPANTLIALAMNSFDGPKYFDKFIKQFGQMANAVEPQASAGVSAQQQFQQEVDEGLKQFEQTMGFKLKEDLLASIGPEGAFAIENFMFNPLMGSSTLDLTLALQIRDKQKVDAVLAKLEESLTTKAPALTGGGMQGGQTPAMKMKEVEFAGAKGKVLPIPQLPSVAIGWVTVGGKYVVLGTSENALKHAAEAYAGAIPSMKSSPDYKKASRYLPAKANSEAVVGVRPVVDLVSNLIMMVAPQIVQGDEGAVVMATMDVVKSVNSALVAGEMNSRGETVTTVVLLLSPAAPSSAPAATEPAKTAPAEESKSEGTETKKTE